MIMSGYDEEVFKGIKRRFPGRTTVTTAEVSNKAGQPRRVRDFLRDFAYKPNAHTFDFSDEGLALRVSGARKAKAPKVKGAPRVKKEKIVKNRLNVSVWHDIDADSLPDDAYEIFDAVLARKKVADKWEGSRFEKIKLIAIGDRGDAGEELVLSYARKRGSLASKDGRLGDYDVVVPLNSRNPRVEVKLATEGATNDSFQFNGIRTDKDFDILLLLAVSPNALHIQAWSRADVIAQRAGTLVCMSQNNKTDHKITKQMKAVQTWADFKDLLSVLDAVKF